MARKDLTEYIVAHSGRRVAELRATGSGVVTDRLSSSTDPDEVLPKIDVQQLLIVVAGGDAGRFSAVVAPWGTSSSMITRQI